MRAVLLAAGLSLASLAAAAQTPVADREITAVFSDRSLHYGYASSVGTEAEVFRADGTYEQVRHRLGLVRGSWRARKGHVCVTAYGTRCRLVLKDAAGLYLQEPEAGATDVRLGPAKDPRNHTPQARDARVCPTTQPYVSGARPRGRGWPPAPPLSLQETRSRFAGRSLSFGPEYRDSTELRADGTTYRYATNWGVPCREYGVYRLHPGYLCLDNGGGGEVCFSVFAQGAKVALRREPAAIAITLKPLPQNSP